jgi:hypothetical protein
MPTYVYKFVETGETIEVQQGFHDDPLTEATHPVTGAVLAVKKVFQPVGHLVQGQRLLQDRQPIGVVEVLTCRRRPRPPTTASTTSSADAPAAPAPSTPTPAAPRAPRAPRAPSSAPSTSAAG